MLQAFRYFVHVACQSRASCKLTCTEHRKLFHPSCQLINQTQRQIRSSKIIKCLGCRSWILCCIFFPFTDQSQTISTDHSIHRPFHSRPNVKLYPQTIPFTDHSIHTQAHHHSQTIPFTGQRQTISTDHIIHGPLCSRTCPSNANNHHSRTISFTNHSIHGPFTDQCHGQINIQYRYM